MERFRKLAQALKLILVFLSIYLMLKQTHIDYMMYWGIVAIYWAANYTSGVEIK